GEMWRGREALIGMCGRVILSDLSEGMLQKAQENLQGMEKIRFSTIDIQDIPFEDNTFDVVIANMMLYHVPDMAKGLGEVRRVLKPGGRFYSATYGEHGIMDYLCRLFRDYGVEDNTSHLFTLQNGKARLSPFFQRVERYDYEDSLRVTHPEDMADYMETLTGMSTFHDLPRDTVLAVLKENMTDGVLTVPKEYGLFVCE
ncbi:MAG: methyltransferase domain-containing protein, partial [Oscillospiraceae bacterium]|nr:methyltransferase domain-containing protein [Oscillospiraceae bacterium]